MSLAVDPEYVIHSLRLAYLRRIDDSHGTRIITFPSQGHDSARAAGQPPTSSAASASGSMSNLRGAYSQSSPFTTLPSAYLQPAPFYHPYATDSHVSLAGLTDPRLHPELLSVHSPLPEGGSSGVADSNGLQSSPLAGDAKARQSKIGSGLRYTSTIYGPGRTGALGMRVSGRRRESKADVTADERELNSVREDPQTAPLDNDAFSPPPPPHISLPDDPESSSTPEPRRDKSSDDSSNPSRLIREAQPAAGGSTAEPALLSTSGSLKQPDSVAPVAEAAVESGEDVAFSTFRLRRRGTNPPSSSYTESSTDSNAVSSIGSPGFLRAGSIDLPSITPVQGSAGKSPVPVELSSSQSTTAEDSDPSDRQGPTARSSPVQTRQAQRGEQSASGLHVDDEPAAEVGTFGGPPQKERSIRPLLRPRKNRARPQQQQEQARSDYFASLKKTPEAVAERYEAMPKTSALSALLNKQEGGSDNPFASFYAGIAGRSGTAPSMDIDLYFPWATSATSTVTSQKNSAIKLNAKAKCMSLNVRKDATMEEVIGYGLYCFAEEGWKPDLDPGGLSEEQEQTRLSTIGWTLRIVEDGEVDEDFPAIDRNLVLSKFGGDEFAIVEATAAQVKQHKEAYGAINRRASRVVTPKSGGSGQKGQAGGPEGSGTATPAAGVAGSAAAAAASTAVAGGRLAVPQLNQHAGSLISVQGTPIFASGALSRSAMGPSSTSIFLRVLVTPNPEVRYKTTLQVPSDMYLADVLEMICRKRHLKNVDEWALVVPDKSIVVPLDRTVESLQGNHDLALVRRSTLGIEGGSGALSTQSSNPNASIFKRFSTEPTHPKYTKALDVTAGYKTFTVYRKTPMFVAARHERSLTLDGDWVHIMPVDMRTFQKAASFHISHVVVCKVSERAQGTFKLVVWRESPKEVKRYDFEAESPRAAGEIVKEINALRAQHA